MQITAKKRLILCILLLILASILASISGCSFYEKSYVSSSTDHHRVDLGTPTNTESYVSSLNAAQSAAPVLDELQITNVIIFIYFNDETYPNITANTIAQFTGEDNSLYDYYYDLSYGKIIISNHYYSTGEGENIVYYAYQAPQNRSYYEAIKLKDTYRPRYEKALLKGAVQDFDNVLDDQINVDQNNDGNVDSVSFVVSGSYVNTQTNWGGLMWPHSWKMSEINNALKPDGDYNPIYLNNKKVEEYTFNFLDKPITGLLCHEFGHVLGAPDLYHYEYDKDYFQVAYWDLMHFECEIPQYMTTYMRAKYLGAKSNSLNTLYTNKISNITQSGDYTLKPTTTVGANDTNLLAYEIEIDDNESIWIEYRNKNVSTYDSKLTGSGLIVYRVNNKAKEGNQKGKRRSVDFPDEVYVYRPAKATTGTIAEKERANLALAYLSDTNTDFNSLGKSNVTNKYDEETIFLTNGANTGIIININSQTDEEISFNVTVPESIFNPNQVSNIEVLDKAKHDTLGIKDSNIVVGNSSDISTDLASIAKVLVTYKDGTIQVATIDNITFAYDKNIIGVAQEAEVRYSDSYNTNIIGKFNLTISDGKLTATIYAYPDQLTYSLKSPLDLTGLALSIVYTGGTSQIVEYKNAEESFSYIGYDGDKSGEYKVEITYTDALGIKDTVEITVRVLANIKSISINPKNSKQLIFFTKGTELGYVMDNLPNYLEVIGVKEDGEIDTLHKDAIDIKTFSWNGLGKAYDIIVQLHLNKTIESQAYRIVLMEETAITGVEIYNLPKLDYGYGESLDLSGGSMLIKMGDNNQQISMQGYYNEFLEVYDCKKIGKQTLTVEIEGHKIALDVIVGSDKGKLLTVNSDTIFMKVGTSNYLRSLSSITLNDFVNSFASMFTIKVGYNDRIIESINAYKDMLVSDKISIHLHNDDNILVATFSVNIIGDTDSNGILDKNDVDNLAEAILSGNTKNDNYDINRDGVYDIVDFVLLLEKVRG